MITPKQAGMAIVIACSVAIPAEGVFTRWYFDPGKIVTVCMGHTGSDIDRNKTYTKDECMALLSKDMGDAVRIVDACVPNLPIGVLAAFSDATFNMGPTIVCDTTRSTAARLLKAGKLKEACEQLPRWNSARIGGVLVPLSGLAKRRAREMEICLKDVT